MFALPGLAGLAVTLVLAAPAFAARVDVVLVSIHPEQYSVEWTASYSNTGSAESNSIVVDSLGGLTPADPVGIRFTDARGHTITAGTDCQSVAPNSAVCRYPCTPSFDYECWWVDFIAVVAKLGPGTDTYAVASGLGAGLPSWVDGGGGADVIYGSGGPSYQPDRLSGGLGNDTILVGNPDTQISCGPGTDAVIWNGGLGTPLRRPSVPADCEVVLPKR